MIIVEGYMDVIMLHKSWFYKCSCCIWNSFNLKTHTAYKKRGDIKVILSFDGDNAGINAAIKVQHF